MEQFEFFQDFKVAVWRRQSFTIEAESYEEALKIAEKYKTVDAASDLYCDSCETLFETEELIHPEENNGNRTIELYAKGRCFIGCNGK